ncbi:MAG: methionyl-tRNA formyltransferase [Paracoccaceae bacterium]|nr:methionyl-tRNA formyltransferase [Paracoccaceae bacterium]
MRIAFMGTPDFAIPALIRLVESGFDIVAVYCRPPRPAGRGQRFRACPVQIEAERLDLPVHAPERLSCVKERDRFAGLDVDVAVVVAYGQILPSDFLKAPAAGCLNVHPSLLPRWRGAAPINRAIMAGDRVTGVSIMQMDGGLDTGPVLMSKEVVIRPRDTADTLARRLSRIGAKLVVRALERLDARTPVAQPRDGALYAARLNREETRIDWSRPAREIDCQIRGLSASPGAWTEFGGERFKILLSEVVAGKNDEGEDTDRSLVRAGTPARGTAGPGTVLDDRLCVRCGVGAIRLLSLQRSGRRALDADDFLRGVPIAAGARFGNP